ncbi:hypothetical protein FQA39_LY02979 [Lamprigera yunnana]|nr:hypothetical protein FQA39_LY02979 [Lamprigera yunnana]
MIITLRKLNNAQANVQSAIKFLQTIVEISIAYIIYVRTDVNRKIFNHRNLNGVDYVIFNTRNKTAVVTDFKEKIQSILDMILKHYLKKFTLIFLDASTENVIETYDFHLKNFATEYEKNGNLERHVYDLLDSFNHLQSLNTLKSQDITPCISLECNDALPLPNQLKIPNYEIMTRETNEMLSRVPADYVGINVNSLKTKFNSLKIIARGRYFMSNTDSRNITSMTSSNDTTNISTTTMDNSIIE